jgi:hypothetical protein
LGAVGSPPPKNALPSDAAALARFSMRFVLAYTFTDVGLWLFTVAGMAAIGWVIWRVLQRQEAKDPSFLKKLDDDDARARGE